MGITCQKLGEVEVFVDAGGADDILLTFNLVGRQKMEHGVVDLSTGAERPSVGDVVHVVSNHCCVVSNMVDEVYGLRAGAIEVVWPVAARGAVR